MKKRFLIVFLVLIGIAGLTVWHVGLLNETNAAGIIIYVDKDNVCPGAGADINPYCSIQNAFNVVNAGDTIRIRNSVTPYDGQNILSRSGTSGNPIIIEPDVGHNPTLRYSGSGADAGVIQWQNQSHITVRNLTFDGAGVYTSRYALRMEAASTNIVGIQVIGNTFRNWGGTAAQASTVNDRAAIYVNGGYCPPNGCPFKPVGTLIRGNAFEANRQNNIHILNANDTIVENNTFSGTTCGRDVDTARNALGVKVTAAGPATGTVIRNNTFQNWESMAACGMAPAGGGAYDTWAGVWCDVDPDNGQVYGNIISNIDQTASADPNGNTSASIGIFIEAGCHGWTVYNNVVSNIGIHGIRQRGYPFGTPPANWTAAANIYYNNTVYSNRLTEIDIGNGRAVIKNNLVYDNGQQLFFDEVVSPGIHDINYNLYHDTAGGNNIAHWGASGNLNFTQ